MQRQIKNYSFDASAGTITFLDYVGVDIERILWIINVSDGNTIYNPVNDDLSGSVDGNVLTLDYDTTKMSDGDKLQICYNDFTQVSGFVWNNELTGVDVLGDIVDTENFPHVSIMGETSATTTLSVYVSNDGVNFYLCEDLSTKVNIPAGLTFHIYFTAGARYFRLASSVDVTATAIVSAKP